MRNGNCLHRMPEGEVFTAHEDLHYVNYLLGERSSANCMQTAESINTAAQRSTGENVRKRKIGSNSLRRRCRFLCFSHVNGLVYRGGGSALTNIRFNFTCRYVVAEACEF